MKFRYSKILSTTNSYPSTDKKIVSTNVFKVVKGKVTNESYRADSIELEKYNFVNKLWELIDDKKLSPEEAEKLYELAEEIYDRGYSEGSNCDFD